MVFNQDGIFSRAEKATAKYGQAKARETLELALSDAQIQKYTTGLTDEELDDKIAGIEGELLPKEKPNKNLQNVIVDGHIFEIDRSIPKIIDYIGPADGVIITAIVTGNDGWVKPGETVSLSGVIRTYSGGTITSSTATVTKGSTVISAFPTTGGEYRIDNISEDTDIKIIARDSNGKSAEKTINIVIKRDGTAPTVEKLTTKVERLKIKFNTAGHDRDELGQEGSGIKHFNYKISSTQDTSLQGIPEDKRTGTFMQGQTVEIETTPTGNRDETAYTITVTAIDNSENISSAVTAEVIIVDGIRMEDLKNIVTASTWKDYIGEKVIYKPKSGGTWRVYYYDEDNYFGDGKGTIYLQTDRRVDYSGSSAYDEADGGKLARQLNPIWGKSQYSTIDKNGERYAASLCNSSKWKDYTTDEVKYAIGATTAEMFVKSYNAFCGSEVLKCGSVNEFGYWFESSTYTVEQGDPIGRMYYYVYIASPSSWEADRWMCALGSSIGAGNLSSAAVTCPIVCVPGE